MIPYSIDSREYKETINKINKTNDICNFTEIPKISKILNDEFIIGLLN
ncbi:MAG: hypothetical protein ACK4YO_01795 [Candidatus Altarchaeaceae archaeon]